MKRKDILEKKPLKTGGMLNALKSGFKTGQQTSVGKAVNTWKSNRKGVEKVGGKPKPTKPVAKATPGKPAPVSYTHLTLPTILRV